MYHLKIYSPFLVFKNDNNYSSNTYDDKPSESSKQSSSMSMPMETDKQREEKRQAELLDIQKELEAKFDEYFVYEFNNTLTCKFFKSFKRS